MGCHFLFQKIFLTQGSNLHLLHCRQILYLLSHWGSHESLAHMGIPRGHLKSMSLDTLWNSLSTCHLHKPFLEKGTQDSTALKSSNQLEFLLSSYSEPEREKEVWVFFLKNPCCLFIFCACVFMFLPELFENKLWIQWKCKNIFLTMVQLSKLVFMQ